MSIDNGILWMVKEALVEQSLRWGGDDDIRASLRAIAKDAGCDEANADACAEDFLSAWDDCTSVRQRADLVNDTAKALADPNPN